jgi:hypothetical protein
MARAEDFVGFCSYYSLGLVFGIQRFYHVDSLQRADQREA